MRWTKLGGHPRLFHPWFAWYPVLVGHEWVWLEVVERQRISVLMGEEWRYRNATR
jgi:hypothetical protein